MNKKIKIIKNIKELQSFLKNHDLFNFKYFFITMTFNHEILKTTTEEEREEKILNFLLKNFSFFVVNKDYGKEEKREHYHAIVRSNFLTLEELKKIKINMYFRYGINLNNYKLGYITYFLIGKKWRFKNDTNQEKIREHLSNHFFKETTKKSNVYYYENRYNKTQEIENLKNFKKLSSRNN